MPVYLLHGFRWPRAGMTGIRVHAIVHNLDDCSVEYIQNANSTAEILKSFRQLFPDIMKELDGPGKGLKFLEQYEPDDEESADAVSQPYAFVGDRVVTIAGGPKAMKAAGLRRPESATSKGSSSGSTPAAAPGRALTAVAAANGSALSVNIEDVIAEGPGLTTAAWEALADLRDKIAEKEKIGWWVVYNGDPERAYDDDDEEEYEEMDEDLQRPAETSAVSKPLASRPSADEKEVVVSPQKPSVPNKEMPPPAPPIKDTGKRMPGTTASAGPVEKLPTEDPAKAKEHSKAAGFKKKFFGKK